MRPVIFLPGLLRPASDWDEVRALVGLPRAEAWPEFAPPWRPDEAAPAFEARLRAHAPDGAHLVGHSRGATLASWAAVHAPELVASLTIVASPPESSEVFRAHFRDRAPLAKDAHARDALDAMASMPEEAFPAIALRRYQQPALVIEAADDPLYSPTHTLFWRMFLPYASFERREGADHATILRGDHARWLAERIARHVLEAQRGA